MDVATVVIWLVVGAIAGWLASKIVRTTGVGLIGDLVVGLVGAVIAGWLLPRIGIAAIVGPWFVDQIIFAAIGAVILLIVLRLFKR
ncbi:MAG TPA: GlsB/YeaQ/YmgE family stress response membrane protein [Xanthobacteraceae bacterium]